MQFFKIEAEVTNPSVKKGKEQEQQMTSEEATLAAVIGEITGSSGGTGSAYENKRLLQTKMTLYLEEHGRDCNVIICSIYGRELLLLGATTQGVDRMASLISAMLSAVGVEYRDLLVEEVTFESARALSDLSSENNFSRSSRSIFERLEIEALTAGYYSNSDIKFKEDIVDAGCTKDDLLRKAERLLCCGSLVPEIERIFAPAKQAAPGHPVHYIIQSDDGIVGEEIIKMLISALYANGRLQSRRYCAVGLKNAKHWNGFNAEVYEALYKSCEGAALAARLVENAPEEDDTMNAEAAKAEHVCRAALQSRNDTLTIFHLPRAAERLKAIMREHLGTMTLVEITEDAVSHEVAKTFLRQSAAEKKVRADRALYKAISDPLKTYSISELHEAFRIWYDNQLKTKCYTQYMDIDTAGRLAAKKKKPRGDAYSELEKMIGLTEAKTIINEAVNFFKAQKLFKDKGIIEGRPSMHMVFSGSPGTAKTSVARLFAQIMKDNGLLSIGGLVEVGRGDLVGKYIGWTAKIVKSKFAEAKGSVLFIDEAYSLVDDKNGLYGDEAINTIVQEMENRREDIVVIFAGYTDKMEEFVARNPGLRSRIAFHVPFADYNTDELLQILELMAGKQSFKLEDGVSGKLMPILENASRDKDFGNGRYIRNLLERARMKQASRLVSMDTDKVTKDELTTLIADDFEAPSKLNKDTAQIGFCA